MGDMVRSPPFAMRRPLSTMLAMLAMLTQIALGVTAPLGLVFCVGESHAAVEIAADDCCASHGSVVPPTVPTIERSCCSDIPLYAATRPVAETRRAADGPGTLAVPSAPVALVPVVAPDAGPIVRSAPLAPPPAALSAVFRV